jgi:hypothetical protein
VLHKESNSSEQARPPTSPGFLRFFSDWQARAAAARMQRFTFFMQRSVSKLVAVGVDEIAWSREHSYLMLVYDIGREVRRLLAVAEDRTEESLRLCLEGLGESA